MKSTSLPQPLWGTKKKKNQNKPNYARTSWRNGMQVDLFFIWDSNQVWVFLKLVFAGPLRCRNQCKTALFISLCVDVCIPANDLSTEVCPLSVWTTFSCKDNNLPLMLRTFLWSEQYNKRIYCVPEQGTILPSQSPLTALDFERASVVKHS